LRRIHLRFYAELNDYLPPSRRQVEFPWRIEGTSPVGELIEGAGVPPGDVDLILANGKPVDFSYRVQAGDRISVYPVFESFDIAPVTRRRPLRDVRFILDDRLARLGRHLRLVGLDALVGDGSQPAELARISRGERRILLTGDPDLLELPGITHGYRVRESRPRAQLAEVVRRFDLAASIAPFKRCPRCNGLLGRDPRCPELSVCPTCGKIYRQDSLGPAMERFVRELQADLCRERG
jgi:uncharacterized protein with PIN domain